MKVVITGTHFTPAQAVIEKLKNYPDVEIVYVGRKYTQEGYKTNSAESQVLPRMGVKFFPVTSGRLQRSFTLYTLPSLLKIPIGFIQSFYILLKEKPDVVLSFGGYIGVPIVVSAWLLSIPVIIHEQTLITGLANTISSHFADKVAVSFNKKYSFSEDKVIFTGNPMRETIIHPDAKLRKEIRQIFRESKSRNLPLILVTGGNQGSHVINQALKESLESLTQRACIIHQTGDSKFRDYEELVIKKEEIEHPQRYVVSKWLNDNDLGSILRKADLAVSRAGVNTLLELAFFGVPALLIPLPYLYKNEQNVNAQHFADLGLAHVLPQRNLSGETLLEDIGKMLDRLKDLKKAAKEAKREVVPAAAERLALETYLLAKRRG